MKPPGTENGIIRYSYLIRAVAILLVILDHCVYRLTSEVVDWKVYAYVFGCNSLLFFMIAGVHNLPVTGVRAFYIKRINRYSYGDFCAALCVSGQVRLWQCKTGLVLAESPA